jgi:hypothetical protein
VLLNRFREREETVKGEVFATFVSLLQQVRLVCATIWAYASSSLCVLVGSWYALHFPVAMFY